MKEAQNRHFNIGDRVFTSKKKKSKDMLYYSDYENIGTIVDFKDDEILGNIAVVYLDETKQITEVPEIFLSEYTNAPNYVYMARQMAPIYTMGTLTIKQIQEDLIDFSELLVGRLSFHRASSFASAKYKFISQLVDAINNMIEKENLPYSDSDIEGTLKLYDGTIIMRTKHIEVIEEKDDKRIFSLNVNKLAKENANKNLFYGPRVLYLDCELKSKKGDKIPVQIENIDYLGDIINSIENKSYFCMYLKFKERY